MAVAKPHSGYDHWSPKTSITKDMNDITSLEMPRNFHALQHSDGVQLSWSNVQGTVFYKIFRSNGEPNNYQVEELTDARENRFIDTTVAPNRTYYYSIMAQNGTSVSEKTPLITINTAFLSPPGLDDLPIEYLLEQCYPNPFNATTTIQYKIPNQTQVNIFIYDLFGRQVLELENGIRNAGNHSVQWNGLDKYGNPVSSGMYLYQIQAGQFTQTKKMVLLK
jgi:hypothetical protein